MKINYNQFGRLAEDTIVTCYYTGEEIEINQFFENEKECWGMMDSSIEEDIEESCEIIRKMEDIYISSCENKINSLINNSEIKELLKVNMITKGTAYLSYIEGIERGDEVEAREMLERIAGAQNRHLLTNYDELRSSGVSRDDAREIINL